jgi:UDP-N-acetylglucosamine 2-epimerase (non-hydrolysing)
MLKILNKNDLKNVVAVIVGTRPGIIKFSPVIRALREKSVPSFIIHTGQHYSYNMDKQFFEDLDLPDPQYTNDAVSKEILHGAQTAEMIKGVEKALLDAKPSLVIVGGDANTNLAGALAARKLGTRLGHMEAGLRSNDWRMPEEHNRVMIDHISDILLAPTEQARKNLIEDKVKGEIYMVGNPIVDVVYQNIEIAQQKSKILANLNIESNGYFLLTIHREENVDHRDTLGKLMQNIQGIIAQFDAEVVFPIHPRTRKRLEQYGLWPTVNNFEKLKIIDAVGYLDFLLLMKNAKLIFTDSGGIQEEACILQVPCITLRENTERPETVEVGANRIVGCDFELTLGAIEHFKDALRDWQNPFGDGQAAKRIASICQEEMARG